MTNKRNAAMQKAIKKAGSISNLARLCHVRRQAVYQWLTGSCPAKRVLQVEGLTGVPRYELRSDIYPREEQ